MQLFRGYRIHPVDTEVSVTGCQKERKNKIMDTSLEPCDLSYVTADCINNIFIKSNWHWNIV